MDGEYLSEMVSKLTSKTAAVSAGRLKRAGQQVEI